MEKVEVTEARIKPHIPCIKTQQKKINKCVDKKPANVKHSISDVDFQQKLKQTVIKLLLCYIC